MRDAQAMPNGTKQSSKSKEVLDLTLDDSDDDDGAVALRPPSRPGNNVFDSGRRTGGSYTPRQASPPQRSPAQTPRDGQPPPSPPESRRSPARAKKESLSPLKATEQLAATVEQSPVANPHLPSPRQSPAPPPAPIPAPAPGPSAAQSPPSPVRAGRRRRRILPPEQRLQVKNHRCRIPPPPPPLPARANLADLALPFLLSRHPHIPLVRPYTRHHHHSSRSASPAESRTTTPVQPPPEAGPSSIAKSSRVGLIDSSDLHWAEIWPAVADMPHLEGSDVESDGNERVFRRDRNPEYFDTLSIPSLLPGRPLAPAQFVPWALDANNRNKPGMLPNPYRHNDMDAEDDRRAQAKREKLERRASESRRREKGKGRAADSDDEMMPPPPPSKKQRRSPRNETEAELQARLRRRLEIDDDTDAEDEAEANSRPTIGFETLAIAVLDQQRAKRKMRRAMGKDPDESTDDEQ
ncbi:RHTO0S01e09780g1_1 [Rhodotorula toruloides]|uniref:RHTO0S01e09780g1_1 n=1 Tax=Rhodotorula toruloides TaxID=5286 RepID=A0A061AMH1_RHOTO|nr:RHTO0S01e09780g1_1 [Rhodotorula toruloides]